MTFAQVDPELEEIELRFIDADVSITNWIEYSFNSNFLTPTDGFSFSIAQENLRPSSYPALVPGAKVALFLNGLQQATGYVDSIERTADRGAGVEWQIEGRDVMSPIIDACSDPKMQFKPTQTLEDVMRQALTPFGWEPTFEDENIANLNVMTGQTRGTRKTKKGKDYKRAGIGQLRPFGQESTFAFISRISQRFGLWIWPDATGKKIIVSTPNFDLPNGGVYPYELIRRFDGSRNNVLSGRSKVDLTDQPTIILADGFGGGGQFGKSRIRTCMHNPFVRLRTKTQAEHIADVLKPYNGVYVLPAPFPITATLPGFGEAASTYHAIVNAKIEQYSKTLEANPQFRIVPSVIGDGSPLIIVERPCILYLHDEESHTQEQLDSFVMREMSLRTRKLLSASYSVRGHMVQSPEGETAPWSVDTIVHVDDEVAGINDALWCMGRTFHKSRSGGTTTHMDLILRNSLTF